MLNVCSCNELPNSISKLPLGEFAAPCFLICPFEDKSIHPLSAQGSACLYLSKITCYWSYLMERNTFLEHEHLKYPHRTGQVEIMPKKQHSTENNMEARVTGSDGSINI